MTCLNCKHNKILRGKENCKDYQFCLEQKNRNSPDYAKECEFYEPKTNADKIRSMTDEELADFIQRVEIGDFNCNDYGKTFCDMCDGQYECDDCLKYWLKQPAEGE